MRRVGRAIGGRREHGQLSSPAMWFRSVAADRLRAPKNSVLGRLRRDMRCELMCGRYCITSAPEAIRALFRYREQPNFPARYNVAPTQPVPIVRMAEGERQFALVRWGLIPAWVKDPKGFALLINARGEIGQRQAGVPQRHEAPPLSVSGRRLLRVEAARRRQAALSRAARGRRADRLRRSLGDLDRAERRGDGDRGDRHHARPTRRWPRCITARR